MYQVAGITGTGALEQNATATAYVASVDKNAPPVVKLINIQGTVKYGSTNDTLIGVDSGIECKVLTAGTVTTDLVLKNSEDGTPLGDNDEIETENIKLNIFDFTETDPFSEGNY